MVDWIILWEFSTRHRCLRKPSNQSHLNCYNYGDWITWLSIELHDFWLNCMTVDGIIRLWIELYDGDWMIWLLIELYDLCVELDIGDWGASNLYIKSWYSTLEDDQPPAAVSGEMAEWFRGLWQRSHAIVISDMTTSLSWAPSGRGSSIAGVPRENSQVSSMSGWSRLIVFRRRGIDASWKNDDI